MFEKDGFSGIFNVFMCRCLKMRKIMENAAGSEGGVCGANCYDFS